YNYHIYRVFCRACTLNVNTHFAIHQYLHFIIFINETATADTYTLSLHDALPICQRREDAGGDAGGPRHAEPDDHERRGAGAHFHAVDFLPSDLAPERLVEPPARPLRLVLRDAEADRLLGGRLADERDGDPFVVHRGEGARRDPRHAEHAAPGHSEERLLGDRGERLDRVRVQSAAPGDLRAER